MLCGVGDFAAAYLDDIVIFSEIWEDRLTTVRSVLSRLQKSGFTGKPSKCQFGMAQFVYLGHVVVSGLVKPESTKIQAVQQTPPPQQVRAFLGLTGYYRHFIPDYATIAAPVSDLTRKNAPAHVTRTAACKRSFFRLQTLIRNLSYKQMHPIAVWVLFSANMMIVPSGLLQSKFLPREERYSTVEKECLGIKLGVHACRVYSLGRPFTIQTDHRSLEWLDRLKDQNDTLEPGSTAISVFCGTSSWQEKCQC